MIHLHPLLLVALFLFAVHSIQAQAHSNAWFRNTISIPVGERVKIDAELQHRRQNGFDNLNMFDKNLMFSFRSWVHYKYREGIKFSLSPFAYFSNYSIIQQKSDETKQPSGEFRFSFSVDLQKPIRKKIYFVNKTGSDYRFYGKDYSLKIRLRNRSGFRYELTRAIYLGIDDELLLNLSGGAPGHLFDHNRIVFYGACQISGKMKIEVGYLHIIRLPGNAVHTISESNGFVNLTYQLNSKPMK